MSKFFAPMDVRNVDLEDWELAGVQGIQYGDRGMTESGRIDHHAGCALTCLVNPVDELELGIGLTELDLQTKVCSRPPAFPFDIRQCFAPINFRLSCAEQIQIWAVQDRDDWLRLIVEGIF